ncbi:MAG: hypothetical protein HOP31_14040 [Ignavibacteria bacterium]|nr:hypothetical protein [Ignavibacteria bacterium]
MAEKKILLVQTSTWLIILIVKLSLTVLFTSCGNKIKEDIKPQKDEKKESSSDKKNESGRDQKKADLKYYFPVSVTNEKNPSKADTSRLSVFSSTMLKAGEPVLYSFENSSHEMIRLLQFKGSDQCTIISLNKDGERIWLSTKILSRAAFLKPQAGGNFVPALNSDGSIDSSKSINYEEYETVANIPLKLELLSSIKTEQTISAWDNLKSCLKGSGYFDMVSYSNVPPESKKSVYWILEARTAGSYQIVERPDASGEFRKCCDLLMELQK